MHTSDEYHPVLSFEGDASDSLENFVNAMKGYGVTLTLEDDSEVEAVLLGLVYDDESQRQLTRFYRTTDSNDFPSVDEIDPAKIERVFAKRIHIA
jgi:hypothetical protein